MNINFISFTRNKLRIKLFVFCTILVSVIGCDYMPTGANYVEKTLLDGEVICLEPALNEDILITDNTTIPYHFELINLEIFRVTFMLGDTIVRQGFNNNPFDIYIDPEDFLDGEYILELELITQSTSNSLADEMNLELYQTIIQWNVTIDKSSSRQKKSFPQISTEISSGKTL